MKTNPQKVAVRCTECSSTYKISESKIPDGGAYAKCRKCASRIFVEKPLFEQPLVQPERNDLREKDSSSPIVIKRCPQFRCNYWIDEEEAHCPNCRFPIQRNFIWSLFEKCIKLAKALCYLSIIILFLVGISSSGFGGAFFVAIFLYLIIIICFKILDTFIFIGVYFLKTVGLSRPIEESCLRKEEKDLFALIESIKEKKNHVLSNLKPIEARKERHFRTIKEDLKKVLSLLDSKIKNTKVRLWRIEMLRWMNEFKPITAKWYHIKSEKECKNIHNELKALQKKGEKLLRKWKKEEDLISNTESGINYIEKVELTLESCKSLDDELMVKKANLSIKGISFIDTTGIGEENNSIDQIYTVIAMAEMQKGQVDEIKKEINNELTRMEVEVDLVDTLFK